MPNYRRAFIEGGTWFFTVNLLDRKSTLLVDNIEILHTATEAVRRRFPFEIDAMVVLPDHIHAVWTLPPDDFDFSLRWNQIKVRFSKSIPRGEPRSPSRSIRGERGIWQRRFWEHLIRDQKDYDEHIDYCWINPLKHGFVDKVEDWPHSTFHLAHRDMPSPDDFEKMLAAHAKGSFGESS